MLRFAASPTGDMLLSDLRIALFNYIISRQKEEDLIVRIEDIDKEKNIQNKDKEILDLLSLFGIEYSQVIYQSEKIRFHTAMGLQLMYDQKAFSCFCSDEWLEKKRDEANNEERDYRYDDACATLPDELVLDNINPFKVRIKKPILNAMSASFINIDSFIIMNQDKTPTYDFSCAVDDMLSDVSIVVLEEDKTNSIIKQEHIRTSLNYNKKIQYIQLPIFLGAPSVKSLLEQGFLPEAILNYLILTVCKSPQEIFTVNESIEWFNFDTILNTPARFNIDKLRDINKQHLLKLEAKELSRFVGFADEEIGGLARVYLQEKSTTKELKDTIEQIFGEKKIPKEFEKDSKLIIRTIQSAPFFAKYDDFENFVMNVSGLKGEDLSVLLRYLLTGSDSGPEMAQIYRYLKNYIVEIVQ